MKNLESMLSSQGVVLLNSNELKTLKGGYGSYTCYCGHVGGEWEHIKKQVEADSVTEALDSMNCGGYGVTCNGN